MSDSGRMTRSEAAEWERIQARLRALAAEHRQLTARLQEECEPGLALGAVARLLEIEADSTRLQALEWGWATIAATLQRAAARLRAVEARLTSTPEEPPIAGQAPPPAPAG